MSYIVKQKKENGTIHIYLATSRHIVTLKQARQSRIYLGILDPKTNELLVGRNTKALSKETIESLEKIGIGYSGGKAPRPGRKSEEQV